MWASSIDAADIEAIVGGYHSDAFRVLGPHAVPRDWMDDAWEVRVFAPHADSVSLLWNGAIEEPMLQVHPSGFWVGILNHHPGRYRLRMRSGGREWVEEDPYRFGPQITAFQLHLHGEGTLYEAYSMLGAHLTSADGVEGVRFAVWAPNALCVSVAGDFNGWDTRRHPMRLRDGGVWELFLPGVGPGSVYKYFIQSRFLGYKQMKADPYAFAAQLPPETGSVVARLDDYEWNDGAWMRDRAESSVLDRPMSCYEVHLGSWLQGEGGRWLTYRELADKLVRYVRDMNYTHVELLPILEHPFTGSWGYQVTGYFAPTSRYGSPADFKYFVDCCHQAGIGVILDWVPAHFPRDAHGLGFFDGTHLYEHEDPRLGEHRDWGTKIFNFGRNEVRNFLVSNAVWWLKQYHIDGLRVDAVASMLYLDFSREPGDWIPNRYGGRENIEAIEFLKTFNEQVHAVPGAISIAEESTSFPGVTRPVYANGLGFTLKWNMGWMHDMFAYFKTDPIYRKFNSEKITFSMLYAFSENYMLPVSHDEVVHGKASLIGKMTGDEWQRFANARAFLAYMYGHPGKKLLFMGCELGQYEEWNENAQLRWDLLQYDYHRKLQTFVQALNALYRREKALYEVDFHWEGFAWVDFRDVESSVISFLRFAKDKRDFLLFVCNFTPVVRSGYRIGVPAAGWYEEILNSDSAWFGGSNTGNGGRVRAEAVPNHGHPASVVLTLPPLGVLALKPHKLDPDPGAEGGTGPEPETRRPETA